MIRINLLGQPRPRAARRAVPLEATLRVLLFALAVGLAFVFLAITYLQQRRQLDETNQKIRALQAEKARLQQVKAQVDQFERQKAVLQQRISVIEQLQRNRTGGQELLTMVANTVSRTDQLWLTSLRRTGNSIDMEGEAGSINSVANFITQLRRSGYFGKVEIKETKENDLAKGVQTFSFTMSAEINAPQGQMASAAPGKS